MVYQKKTRNLNDLAEKAGVTAATVSMALRNSPRLSEAVREKIRKIAEEDGFTPRPYQKKSVPAPAKRFAHLGPVLFLDNSVDEADPIGASLLVELGQLMNRYGVDFHSANQSELSENPRLLDGCEAVFFYNDPENIGLVPESIPTVQVFGWEPLRKNCDRITADDEKIVEQAVTYLLRSDIDRSAVFWRSDMVRFPQHPRIVHFLERMNAAGVEAAEFVFGKYDTDFTERLKAYIESGSEKIGFFGFNARCGTKLCCGLDSLGLLQKYTPHNVIVCDSSIMLKNFWPTPAMIDLDMPLIARRALELLFFRMEAPGVPEAMLLQFPRPLA